METTHRESLHCPDCGAQASEDSVRCAFCGAVLSRTACPSCFGPMFLGMRFCPRCGTPAERKDMVSDKPLPCPRCGVGMETAELARTRIHECSSCGGLWISADSFQRIVDDAEGRQEVLLAPISAADPAGVPEARSGRFYVPCPECGELMNRKNFSGISGVVLDICRTHGLWFDRKELQGIADFIEKGGLEKARRIELEELRQEQDRLKAMKNAPEASTVDLAGGSSFLSRSPAGSLARVVRAVLDRLLD
jgi:Zn-finger nucleic acid-binding protein